VRIPGQGGREPYRLASESAAPAALPIGYAAQGQDTRSIAKCAAALVRAAEREHGELIVVDNRYQPKIALRSADY